MWVIVLVMFDGLGAFKVASDQMLYASWDLCNGSRVQLHALLERSKPNPNAVIMSTCTDVSEQDTT